MPKRLIPHICHECGGSGWVQHRDAGQPRHCHTCGGSGFVEVAERILPTAGMLLSASLGVAFWIALTLLVLWLLP